MRPAIAALQALFSRFAMVGPGNKDAARANRLRIASELVERPISSLNDLSDEEAWFVNKLLVSSSQLNGDGFGFSGVVSRIHPPMFETTDDSGFDEVGKPIRTVPASVVIGKPDGSQIANVGFGALPDGDNQLRHIKDEKDRRQREKLPKLSLVVYGLLVGCTQSGQTTEFHIEARMIGVDLNDTSVGRVSGVSNGGPSDF